MLNTHALVYLDKSLYIDHTVIKTMKCLKNLLSGNQLFDSLCLKSYRRGGENAGILREVQKEG